MLNVLSIAQRNRIKSLISMSPMYAPVLERKARDIANRGLLRMLAASDRESAAVRAFSDFCLRHYGSSFSQLQQDLFVLWKTGEKRDGTFIEFGAADGITHSNTLMLERDYGWRGVLIEPLPWHRKELLRKRPEARVLSGAIDPGYGEAPAPIELVVAGQLSSISGFHENDSHAAFRRSSSTRIKVPALNLNRVVREHVPSGRVDFMSIDVEGPELAILRGFDFARTWVGIVCVEVNDRDEDRHAVTALMAERGFHSWFDPSVTRADLWLVNRDL